MNHGGRLGPNVDGPGYMNGGRAKMTVLSESDRKIFLPKMTVIQWIE